MIWKRSLSFPDYEVSEYGDVRRIVPAKGGPVGRIMKAYVREDGYRMYILRRDERSFHRKAHQLVIEVFVGPKPFPLAEVCHNDGTRSNDHYSNLRWDTRKGNHADKRKHGTSSAGERHPHAKLTLLQVMEIKERVARGEIQRVIGLDYGIRQGAVSRIVSGQRWAHV